MSAKVQGWSEQGGSTVTITGAGTSTATFQESFASCVVTVYEAGTLTLSSIYSDNIGTVKANPFTASSTGYWFFYVSGGRYDVRFSGGTISAPFTLGDMWVVDADDMWVNVKSSPYNAVGDGVTDDTTAINAAWAVIASTGGTLYFPTGNYFCADGLDFSIATNDTTHSWVIRGDGMTASVLVTTDANISLDLGGRNRVTIEDFGIYDNGTTANVGIARYRVLAIAPATNGPGHFHLYKRLQIRGMYAMGCLYSIASEVNDHYTCQFYNYGNGAAYYTSPTNSLSLTGGQTFAGAGDSSNTVSNWYGGTLQGTAATTGGAVNFGPGIVSNINFYGTYLVGYAGGYNIKFGYHQGPVLFNGCRFEGTAHAIQQADDGANPGELWSLHCIDNHFGQDNGATDCFAFYWGGTNAGAKLVDFHFDHNWLHDNDGGIRSISVTAITGSYVKLSEYSAVFGDNTIAVSGNIVGCYLEAPNITLGATTQVISSKLVTQSVADKVYRESYGPNPAYHGVNDPYSSAVIFNPFKTVPDSPAQGMIVTAYGSASSGWDPVTNEASKVYPVFYDGSAWKPMIPVPSTANSKCRFIYTEANTDEKVLHTLTIPAGTLAAAFKHILRIRASGRTANNTNTKTIRLKLADSTNTVTLVQNTVTTAPQNLSFMIEAEIAMASTYTAGYWAYSYRLQFNGIAPQMNAGIYSAAGDVIGFDEAVTLSLTGQNGTAAAADISGISLTWEMVHAE